MNINMNMISVSAITSSSSTTTAYPLSSPAPSYEHNNGDDIQGTRSIGNNDIIIAPSHAAQKENIDHHRQNQCYTPPLCPLSSGSSSSSASSSGGNGHGNEHGNETTSSSTLFKGNNVGITATNANTASPGTSLTPTINTTDNKGVKKIEEQKQHAENKTDREMDIDSKSSSVDSTNNSTNNTVHPRSRVKRLGKRNYEILHPFPVPTFLSKRSKGKKGTVGAPLLSSPCLFLPRLTSCYSSNMEQSLQCDDDRIIDQEDSNSTTVAAASAAGSATTMKEFVKEEARRDQQQEEPPLVLPPSATPLLSSSSSSSTSSLATSKPLLPSKISLQQKKEEQEPTISTKRLEYEPSEIPNFWHCPNCKHLSLSQRAKHSVIFHPTASSDESKMGKKGAKNNNGRKNRSRISNRSRGISSSSPSSLSPLSTESAGATLALSPPPPSSDEYDMIAVHSFLCEKIMKTMTTVNLSPKFDGEGSDIDASNCSSPASTVDSKSVCNSGSDCDESNSDNENDNRRKSRRLYKKNKQREKEQSKGGVSQKSNMKKKTSTKKKKNEVGKQLKIDNEYSSSEPSAKKRRGGPKSVTSPSSSNDIGNSDIVGTSLTDNLSSSSSKSHARSRKKRKLAPVVKEVTKVGIPSTDNGLIDLDNDVNTTASIDYYVMSQVKRCSYTRSNDTTSHLRQKVLPEGYPGVQCLYCDKQWFFNSAQQLATGFPKIEQHLAACRNCPKEIKQNICTTKNQEELERNQIYSKTGERPTRRKYATIVIGRLGAPEVK